MAREATAQAGEGRKDQEVQASVQASVPPLRVRGGCPKASSGQRGSHTERSVAAHPRARPGLFPQGHSAGEQNVMRRRGRRGVPPLHQDRATDAADEDDRRGSRHRGSSRGTEEREKSLGSRVRGRGGVG